MAKKKHTRKIKKIDTATNKKLLAEYDMFCHENENAGIDEFFEFKITGVKPVIKLKEGGLASATPIEPEPISSPPIINEPATIANTEPVLPLDASSPIPVTTVAAPIISEPVNDLDKKLIAAAAESYKGQIPVYKAVEILGRMPRYREKIGSIFLQKVPFTNRYRIEYK